MYIYWAIVYYFLFLQIYSYRFIKLFQSVYLWFQFVFILSTIFYTPISIFNQKIVYICNSMWLRISMDLCIHIYVCTYMYLQIGLKRNSSNALWRTSTVLIIFNKKYNYCYIITKQLCFFIYCILISTLVATSAIFFCFCLIL